MIVFRIQRKRGNSLLSYRFLLQETTSVYIATLGVVTELRRFGIDPKAAFVSHSNFGTDDTEDTIKLRKALKLVHAEMPDLEIDGEMHGDRALNEAIRQRNMTA